MKVKSGDQVLVISGKEKGNKGKVLRIFSKKNRVVVEGLKNLKRHTKPSQQNTQGGILEYSAPMNVSNVMLICNKCNTPTRQKIRVLEDGSKARICTHCEEII